VNKGRADKKQLVVGVATSQPRCSGRSSPLVGVAHGGLPEMAAPSTRHEEGDSVSGSLNLPKVV
jgi:hypothetical protein